MSATRSHLSKKNEVTLHLRAIVRHASVLRSLAVREHNRRALAHIRTRARKMLASLVGPAS